MDGLRRLNALPEKEAVDELQRCCGSARWAKGMAQSRPFRDERQLIQAADATWRELGPSDWLQAFAAHPKIGDREAKGWAAGEQSGASAASKDVLDALSDGNREYETKFGHIFIVCASGKTAEQMLELLRARMGNEPVAELKIAAEEQRKITALRLTKLVGGS